MPAGLFAEWQHWRTGAKRSNLSSIWQIKTVMKLNCLKMLTFRLYEETWQPEGTIRRDWLLIADVWMRAIMTGRGQSKRLFVYVADWSKISNFGNLFERFSGTNKVSWPSCYLLRHIKPEINLVYSKNVGTFTGFESILASEILFSSLS